MRLLLSISACLLALSPYAQVPQGIGYQGVATDTQGLELTNQSISVRASIMSGAVNGEVQWQETHATSTDDFGLFALTIGEGANTGEGQLPSFSDIPWGDNAFFLQIEMDASGGNDYIFMGVDQMMSVPYALYAENTAINYESIENYLLQDSTFIENITNVLLDSLANAIAVDSLFICNVATILNDGGCDSLMVDDPNDTNWTCGDTITYWDYQYNTVLIGDQCWFSTDLFTDKYATGDIITYQSLGTGIQWVESWIGLRFSKYYNWLAIIDPRGLCPEGWKVPSDGDWRILEEHLGMTPEESALFEWRGSTQGAELKASPTDILSWDGTNSTGFTANKTGSVIAGGGGSVSGSSQLVNSGLQAVYWSRTPVDDYNYILRLLQSDQDGIKRYTNSKQNIAHAVRCVQD